MRRDNINYLMVGSFVLVMVALLMVSIYLVTGRTGPSDRYHINYRQVTGLKYGTPVFYDGYQVGQVEGITPRKIDGSLRYRVDVSVVKDWEIPSDSVARMMASGLLSAITVNIIQGDSKRYLKPGQEIRGEEGGDIFSVLNGMALDMNQLANDSLIPFLDTMKAQVNKISGQFDQSAPAIVADVQSLLNRLNDSAARLQALLSDDNRQKLDTVLNNLERTSKNAAQVSDSAIGITRDAGQAAANLARLSQDVNHTREQVDQLITEVHGVVSGSRPQVERSLRELRKILSVASQHVEQVAQDMEGTSRNMYEFSRQIRGNPGLLLGGKPPAEEPEAKP